jgi:hypothetical protein
MTAGRERFQQSKRNIQNLGLNKIPFTESPTELAIEPGESHLK